MKKTKSKKKSLKLEPFEQVILLYLIRARRPLTTLQISKQTKLSWSTVKKYVHSLNRKKKIQKNKLSNKTYWEIK